MADEKNKEKDLEIVELETDDVEDVSGGWPCAEPMPLPPEPPQRDAL
jgi:hypothetical protein